MLKIRRPLGRLIFNMGIAIPGKTVFLIETAPCFSYQLPHQVNVNSIDFDSCWTPRYSREPTKTSQHMHGMINESYRALLSVIKLRGSIGTLRLMSVHFYFTMLTFWEKSSLNSDSTPSKIIVHIKSVVKGLQFTRGFRGTTRSNYYTYGWQFAVFHWG